LRDQRSFNQIMAESALYTTWSDGCLYQFWNEQAV